MDSILTNELNLKVRDAVNAKIIAMSHSITACRSPILYGIPKKSICSLLSVVGQTRRELQDMGGWEWKARTQI